MEWYAILLSILAGILALDYLHSRFAPNIFQQRGIPYMKRKSFLENLLEMFVFRKVLLDLIQVIYDVDKEKEPKYIGVYNFTRPVVLIRDVELMKLIGIKNFESFPDHLLFGEEIPDPLFGNHLISLRGNKWRKVRSIMSPTFTSSKMKAMYPLMNEVAINYSEYLANLAPEERVIEMKDVFSRYSTDVIATCAFGISVDSVKNPQNEFYIYGKKGTDFKPRDAWKFLLALFVPSLVRVLKISISDSNACTFFTNVVADTIRMREEKGITRPDMIQIMMESRDKEYGNEMTVEAMTSQAFAFFLGGFESSATTLALIMYEIAKNPETQEKLQKEIDGVMEETKGQPTYEAINKMVYLDAVMNEILRLYPSAPFMDRLCVKDFELPPSIPDAKPYVVKKGTLVWFPFSGIQRDARNFLDPMKFKPERFLDEKQEGPHNLDAFRPFGLGPRMCIGNRFALLQMKMMVFYLLARCELRPCKKTQIPMRWKEGKFLLQSETGIWLDVVPR